MTDADHMSPSDIKLLEVVRRANLPKIDFRKKWYALDELKAPLAPAVTPDHLDDSSARTEE